MTATNHALTGAIIGLVVSNPVVAIPLAFVSHYAMDALPHFRPSLPDEQLYRSKWFAVYLMAEAMLCFSIVLVLFIAHPADWRLGAVCAFVAAAPDLLSIPIYKSVRSGRSKQLSVYTRFASGIQWFEKPIGAAVEVAWFAGAVLILANIL